MKKDLIIGCYTGYDWDKIKFWANSIDKSGFTGDKAMIVYNSDYETVQKLIDRNFIIYAFNRDDVNGRMVYDFNQHIVVQRFIDLYNAYSILNMNKYRYIITTDVKDVVFQENPTNWLNFNTNHLRNPSIIASSESLYYQNEPWGNENMMNSFPEIYDEMKENIIWNCGVQAGNPTIMRDLWLNIYLLCQGNRVHNPDQAAYNVLLNMNVYKTNTMFLNGQRSWAAQLGTTMDPTKINGFRPNLLDKEPIILNDIVCNEHGEPYTIVHQYDRIPGLKHQIEQKYAN